jgi:hypothetical protein
MEMPAEAREASAAMRRAISEQIDAINELSTIVARSTGEAMVLPPPTPAVAAAAAAPAPAPTLPTAAAPAVELPPAPPKVEPQAAPKEPPAPPAKPKRPEPKQPELSEVSAEPFGKPTGAKPVEHLDVEPKSFAKPSRPKPGNGEARGWVADLLRRASSDEDEEEAVQAPRGDAAGSAGGRSPAQVVDSLNSLSIDIARAIDHEASVELWDRYKRGERNVFTRRLYTLQGQKTFDELRRKYEHDGEFRRAVDNYIGDFERLLAQVAKDDTDPAVSRMYLTSDTGKVYTMLAHAAGRLS